MRAYLLGQPLLVGMTGSIGHHRKERPLRREIKLAWVEHLAQNLRHPQSLYSVQTFIALAKIPSFSMMRFSGT